MRGGLHRQRQDKVVVRADKDHKKVFLGSSLVWRLPLKYKRANKFLL